MSWVRIDDTAPDHPKFVRAGHAAFALWVAGIAYCNRHHTDGRIPKEALGVLLVTMSRSSRDRAASKLCSNGDHDHPSSWLDCGSYYQVHEFQLYQLTKAELDKRRQQDRERQRRHRQRLAEDSSRHMSHRDVIESHTVTSRAPASQPKKDIEEPPSVEAAPPAEARVLTPQQQAVERAWAIFDRFEARRPTGGVIAHWRKELKGDTDRLCRLLEDEGPRGGLGKGERYIYAIVQGGGNGDQGRSLFPPPTASPAATADILARAKARAAEGGGKP